LPRCSGLAASWRWRRSPLWPEPASSSGHQTRHSGLHAIPFDVPSSLTASTSGGL
jgi:hypothetical protein